MTRRLRRGSRACSPMGRSIASSGDPKGVQGGERKATLLAATGNNFAESIPPWWGLTRRLRRGLGLAIPRGAHTFLSVAKEKCAKESQRHSNSCGPPRCASRASVCGSPFGAVLDLSSLRSPFWEKALYYPFLKEGVRNVARSMVKLTTFTFVRARAHSFPLSKRARLFPSAAYRRSAPPQLAWGMLTPCGLKSFNVVGKFCGVDKRTGFLFTGDGGHTPPLQVGMLRCGMNVFAAQKASVSLISRWP